MKTSCTLALTLALATAHTVHAQLPVANAAGFGMAGNFTAVARGFGAIAVNPANLALGQPNQFGISLFAVNVSNGINPITFGDFKAHQNVPIPAATRESWLQKIGSGRQTGGMSGGVSLVALNVRNFGMQVGVVGAGDVNLNQDAAEALLFGNAGRTGTAKSFNFSGSKANGSLFGVGAVSYGMVARSTDRGEQLTFGVTGKYVRGIAAARAADHGSVTTPDAINVEFPVIHTDSTHVGNAGSGFGIDLGFAWAKSGTSVSITARNVVNSFRWSTEAFTSRAGGFTFDGINNGSDFDAAPYANAPAPMRSAFEAEKFMPEMAAGVAHKFGDLLLTVDGSQRFGDGIKLGPKMRAGVGAEYTGLSVLALRGGFAAITDGFQAAAGVGLRVGTFELGVGGMTRTINGQGQTGFMFSMMARR
jgi:hypothetical protein